MSETKPASTLPAGAPSTYDVINPQRYPYEAARIAFLCARDGVAGAGVQPCFAWIGKRPLFAGCSVAAARS